MVSKQKSKSAGKPTKKVTTNVVVLAGGGGIRTGLTPIADGSPIVVHTLSQFHLHPKIDGILLVTDKKDREDFKGLVKGYGLSKVMGYADSGETRYRSVYNGLVALPPCDVALIQNSNNPFVTPAEINAVISTILESGAAAVGRPVKDTIKVLYGGGREVVKTWPRSEPFYRFELQAKLADGRIMEELVQTESPQGALFPVLLKAYEALIKNGKRCTDDLEAIEVSGVKEHKGKRVQTLIVLASPLNQRISSKYYLPFAAAMLREFMDKWADKQTIDWEWDELNLSEPAKI